MPLERAKQFGTFESAAKLRRLALRSTCKGRLRLNISFFINGLGFIESYILLYLC